jgi:hypothetical protein
LIGSRRQLSMSAFLEWFRTAPPSALPIISAALGTATALMVAVLTPWVLGRRARTDPLTKKLEELYLAVLQWTDEVDAAKMASDSWLKEADAKDSERPNRLPRTDRRVAMYVGLYFPRLERARRRTVEANRIFAKAVRECNEGVRVDRVALQRAWLELHLALGPLRQNIQENTDCLVRRRLVARRFKATNVKENSEPGGST